MKRAAMSWMTVYCILACLAGEAFAGSFGITDLSQQYSFSVAGRIRQETYFHGFLSSTAVHPLDASRSSDDGTPIAGSYSGGVPNCPIGSVSADFSIDRYRMRISTYADPSMDYVYGDPSDADGFLDYYSLSSDIRAVASALWVFRPERSALALGLRNDGRLDYGLEDSSMGIALTDLTTGRSLLSLDSLGIGERFLGDYSLPVDPTHTYALSVTGVAHSRDAATKVIDISASIRSVPEPGSSTVLGVGLAALALAGFDRKRRRGRSAPGR